MQSTTVASQTQSAIARLEPRTTLVCSSPARAAPSSRLVAVARTRSGASASSARVIVYLITPKVETENEWAATR